MGFCFCSDLLFIGGGDREPQSFQSPGAPPAKNGSQSSSAGLSQILCKVQTAIKQEQFYESAICARSRSVTLWDAPMLFRISFA